MRVSTNVDEFLRIREGELVAHRSHDCLLARVEIFFVTMENASYIRDLLTGQRDGNEGIPFGCDASVEDEPLPPKIEDIFCCFQNRWRWRRRVF